MKKIIWVLMAMLVVSVAINCWQCSRQPQESTVVEHDTVWKDTAIYEPQAAETINTGRVVYISIPFPGERDTITLHDSIDVPVPIYQKRYDDSLYTAWVSGFEPNLDSIRVREREIITTITKVVDRPASRFSIGPSVGLGYGVMNKQCDVFIGVTATWSLTK